MGPPFAEAKSGQGQNLILGSLLCIPGHFPSSHCISIASSPAAEFSTWFFPNVPRWLERCSRKYSVDTGRKEGRRVKQKSHTQYGAQKQLASDGRGSEALNTWPLQEVLPGPWLWLWINLPYQSAGELPSLCASSVWRASQKLFGCLHPASGAL
jgi:hypothetical protein